MEAQTGIEPIQCRREQHALTFWERQRRILPQKWDEYRQAASRLKTQTTPLTVANQITEKYHIVLSEAAPFPAQTTLARCLPNTELLLENHNDLKHLSSDIALRKAALETIHTKYPAHEWIHIYCDGSSMPDSGRTGAGYVSTFFKGSIAVGAPLTNYDGEIAAIHEAAKNLENFQHPQKVAFFIDCQAEILALSTNRYTDCAKTISCRVQLSNLMEKGWLITLQWIPSHVGVEGNEAADELAKEGTTLPQPPSFQLYTSAKSTIRRGIKAKIKEQQIQAGAGKSWAHLIESPIPRNLPRPISAAVFRTTTGHDYLASHLHRIGVRENDNCPLCDQPQMDAAHLPECPALKTDKPEEDEDRLRETARLYWSARHQMANMPRVGVG
ncbi:uncharacterized protein [Diabrotica undecimpunctata]|uniref:uncharacterized protein n=1 Tax=Diabrotica undecimpunctata TaxID=50387 RepID=UPI003B640EA1